VAWTSDAKGQWGADWIGWDGFSTFWTQTVRWAAAGTTSDVQVTLDRDGAATSITVDSADASGAFRNDLLTTVTVLGPDGSRQDISLTQVAPGRYSGEIGELPPGAYLLGVTQREEPGGPVVAGATSGLVVGYSPEYGAPTGDGQATLERARDIAGGIALDPNRPADAFLHDLPPATVQTPLWPWLTLAALLLLPLDIAVRRLAIGRRELAGLRAAVGRRPSRAPEHRATHATVLVSDQRRRLRQRRDARSPEPKPSDEAISTRSPSQTGSPAAERVEGQPAQPERTSSTTGDLLAAKRRAIRRDGPDASGQRQSTAGPPHPPGDESPG
jgi:hypothetical protein